ncbi:hypothetical protein KFE25_000161 [Diacronema lutheri]|uniref:MULE transposase domain-containing protein n=1 Tax=Diacronema lutheri TaxID=2081491 RepID=A0A8J5XH36_DIALT|nr:hypothetical protein KFE25_000161 [Diacronema lutheri]
MEGGFEAYARNETKNVIMFDTTWGTNRYNMKLGFFTTVGLNGETLILAAVIMMHETRSSFQWAFERFKECFKIPPAVIITDGDPGIIVWHAVLNAWWRLAKQTDVSAKATFDDDFQKIVDVVAALKPKGTDTRATAKHAAAIKWLEWLRSVKHTWAACFTWAICTLGVHSTQRSESIHAAIKRLMLTNLLLTDLVKALDMYKMCHMVQGELRKEKQQLTLVYYSKDDMPA